MDNTSSSGDFSRQIGQVIGSLRRHHGWTQGALADQLGVSQRRVAKLESGAFDLRLSTIQRLAQVFGVTPGQLLDTTPDHPGSTLRQRGPLQGLAQTGWTRAKPNTPGAVPVLDLRPRAGRTRAQAEPLVIAWAAPPAGRHPRESDLFLAQVRGDSMLPTLSDGQWCLFARQFSGDELLGKACLVRESDPNGLTAWSIKRVTRLELGPQDRLQLQMTSLNPAYSPRDVEVDAGSDVSIEAVLREALRPNPTQRKRPHPAAAMRPASE